MRGLVLIALVFLAGCDKLFGLLPVPDDHDAAQDASSIDAPNDAAVSVDAGLDAFVNRPCPTSYSGALNASRYRLVGTAATWHAAQATCLADRSPGILNHTHLVVLGDDSERSHVFNNVSFGGMHIWIGLTDTKDQGFFRWITDENTSGYPPSRNSPWASGQPSNGTSEDCVKLNGTADLDDVNCGTALVYVCECDAFPNNPGNYN